MTTPPRLSGFTAPTPRTKDAAPPTRAEIDSAVAQMESIDKGVNIFTQALHGTVGALSSAYIFTSAYVFKHIRTNKAGKTENQFLDSFGKGGFKQILKSPFELFKHMSGGGKTLMAATMATGATLGVILQRRRIEKIDHEHTAEIKAAIAEAYAQADSDTQQKSFVEKLSKTEPTSTLNR